MPKKREDDLNWFSWTAHIKCPLNTLEPLTGLTSNFLQWSPLGYIIRARPLKTSVTFFSSQYCYLSISWMVTERVNFFLIFYPRISCNMNVFTVRFYHFLLYTWSLPNWEKHSKRSDVLAFVKNGEKRYHL